MSKIRRTLRGVLLFVAAAVLLMPVVAGGQQKTFEGVTLEVMILASHSQFDPVWERLEEFENETGMKVNFNMVYDWPEVLAKTLRDARLHEGRFDVFEVSEDAMAALKDYVEPLNSYIERDFGMSVAEWKERWLPIFADFVDFDGSIVCYPFYGCWQLGLHRADLFEDPNEKAAFKKIFGYDLGPPKSLTMLVDVAKFFTRDTDGDGDIDLWGLLTSGGRQFQIFNSLWWQSGRRYYDEEGHCMWGPEYPENQWLAEDIARFMQNMVHKWGVTPAAVVGMDLSPTLDLYLEGNGAMVYSWAYLAWKEAQLPETIARIGRTESWKMPGRIPGMGVRGGGWYRAISGDSKQKDAAWEFIKWACSDENIKLALTDGPGSFCAPSIELADWAARERIIPPAMAEAAMEEMRPFSRSPAIPAAAIYMREMCEKLLEGRITPEEWTKQTGEELERLGQRAQG